MFETNFRKNVSVWAQNTWVYTTTFSLDASALEAHHPVLVLYGVKMGARVRFNGQLLGIAETQFARYTFDISAVARANTNTIEVEFDPSINVDGRFMACSAGIALIIGINVLSSNLFFV